MKRNNLFSKILGWCPGFQAATSFQERDLSAKFSGLALLLATWLAGLWLAMNAARGLTGMDLTLFTNRAMLLLLLGSIVVVGYAWKSFKPRDWRLEEFSIRPTSIDDLPDFPVEDSYTWGAGSAYYTPIAVDPQWGGERYKVVGVRGTSIDWYRDRIEHHKRLRKKKAEKDESTEAE
jgi:hypothetical protein